MTTPAWLDRHLNVPARLFMRIPTGLDEYGNVVYGDSGFVDGMCFIQPVSQEEIQDGRAEVGQYLVHLRSQAADFFDGFARIEIGGVSYEVVGPQAVYPSLTRPGVHHVEVIVQRSTA